MDNNPGTSIGNENFATIPDVSVDAIANRVAPRQVASGVTRGVQQLGSQYIYSDGGNQQIIVEDTSNPRVMMGNHSTFGEGFFVSKAGTNVKTNTNPANLIFNSSQDTFKIVVSNTATQPVASLAQDATTTLTVAHNLGYIPAAIVYLNGTGSNYLTAGRYYVPPVPVPVKVGATYYPGVIHTYSIDATNIYFMVTNSSAATPITDIGTVNWKYYLLQESAS